MVGLVSQDWVTVERERRAAENADRVEALGPGGRPKKVRIPRQLQGPPGEEPWRIALTKQRAKALANIDWDCGECGLESTTRPRCSHCGCALVGAGFVGGPDR